MIIGFLVRRDLSDLPNNIARIFGSAALHAAGLVAENGIPVVDLLRHDRDFSRGDPVPDERSAARHESAQRRRFDALARRWVAL